MSRIIVIASILMVFAAIAVNANWGRGFGLSTTHDAVISTESPAELVAPTTSMTAAILGSVNVSLPDVTATPGLIIVPITVSDLTGLGVLYFFTMTCKSVLIRPL